MTVADLLCHLRCPEDHNLRYYLAGDNMRDRLPQLQADVTPLPIGENDHSDFFPPKDLSSLGVWMGRNNQITSAHFDCVHNLMTVITGEKLFTLASPQHFLNMYPHTFKTCGGKDQDGEIYRYSQVNVLNPDLKAFPRFGKVTFICSHVCSIPI